MRWGEPGPFRSGNSDGGCGVLDSETRGFWPKAGDSGIYLADDVGLTTVYFGGYNTGAMLSWILVPELLNLDLAVTNAAVSSQADHTNLFNGGGILHLGFQPVIYWQQGISASFGTFMQRADINSNHEGLEKFNQIVKYLCKVVL